MSTGRYQLTNYLDSNLRVEKFDDLVDSFTLLIHKIIENNHGKPDILWLDWGPPASERGWRPLTSLSDLSRW